MNKNRLAPALRFKRALNGRTAVLLQQTKVREEDVGRIFITNPSMTNGQIIDVDEFKSLDPDSIASWVEVTQEDVNAFLFA